VPNHESNGFSGIDDSLYTSTDRKYHCTLDDKENKFLNLESDPEDEDQIGVNLCDFPNSPTFTHKVTDTGNQCFDLSLDSDTEYECEESLELECDDCDEGDDLLCSMQVEQCESIIEPSGDQLVYKIPDVSSLTFNNITDLDQNNEIYMDLPSHDDLSSATVEVLAVSSESLPVCDIQNVATTSGSIMVDQLNTVTTVCYTSSQNLGNEDMCSPLKVTINTELIAEQKQKCVCGSPETYTNDHIGEKESTCVVSTASLLPQEAHDFPVDNNVS